MLASFKTYQNKRRNCEGPISNEECIGILKELKPKEPVPLYELEQEVCRIAKNLTSWQFLTIRLSPTIIHEAFPKTVKKSPRPLKRPLRIIKKLLRTITTCQTFNKMPPRNNQDAVKNYQHILIYSNQ